MPTPNLPSDDTVRSPILESHRPGADGRNRARERAKANSHRLRAMGFCSQRRPRLLLPFPLCVLCYLRVKMPFSRFEIPAQFCPVFPRLFSRRSRLKIPPLSFPLRFLSYLL